MSLLSFLQQRNLPWLQLSDTLCPSAPVRCAPVASLVDKFTEIASPVQNYDSPAKE